MSFSQFVITFVIGLLLPPTIWLIAHALLPAPRAPRGKSTPNNG
jgi:hypothetical protein